jgi:O-acetylhomoserine (thiol)-lyase
MNPTTDVLEKRMASLEGGLGALATSSGSAATTYAIMNICQTGNHIVSSKNLYGGTFNLFMHTLPRYGIHTTFVDCSQPELIHQGITDKTRCIFLETIGNPQLEIPHLEQIAQIAHARGLPLIVDNTLATPFLCRPFEFGADIVIHSLTKFCGGHGTSLGGIIIDSGQFDWGHGSKFPMFTQPDPSHHHLIWTQKFGTAAYIMRARSTLLRDMGACIAPFNSFLLLQGLETFHLRMERHCENALAVARYLEDHPKVNWVLYPGLASHPTHWLANKYLQAGGALVGFGIRGGQQSGRQFIENLQLFSHLANIGDAKSLAVHPASTTHAQLSQEEQIQSGVTEDFIRLSIGLEHIDDIIEDLKMALSAIS